MVVIDRLRPRQIPILGLYRNSTFPIEISQTNYLNISVLGHRWKTGGLKLVDFEKKPQLWKYNGSNVLSKMKIYQNSLITSCLAWKRKFGSAICTNLLYEDFTLSEHMWLQNIWKEGPIISTHPPTFRDLHTCWRNDHELLSTTVYSFVNTRTLKSKSLFGHI